MRLQGYQVQNLGVSGYGLGQYYLYLQKHLRDLSRLELLVRTIFTGNDLTDTASAYSTPNLPLIP